MVDADAVITVTLKSDKEDVFLTLDGQVGVELKCGDVIRVGAQRTGPGW